MNIHIRTHRPNWSWDESAAARTSGGVTLRRPPIRVAIVPAIIPKQTKTAKSRRVKTGKPQMKATKNTKTTSKAKPAKKILVSFHALRTAALRAMKIDPFSKDALQAVIKKAA